MICKKYIFGLDPVFQHRAPKPLEPPKWREHKDMSYVSEVPWIPPKGGPPVPGDPTMWSEGGNWKPQLPPTHFRGGRRKRAEVESTTNGQWFTQPCNGSLGREAPTKTQRTRVGVVRSGGLVGLLGGWHAQRRPDSTVPPPTHPVRYSSA